MNNGSTSNKVIKSEFNSAVKSSFSKIKANEIILMAKKNGYDEKYCFDIYSEITRPMGDF